MSRRTHSSDFKREAVKLALTSGLPRHQIADDLGIGKSTLGKWITKYKREQLDNLEPADTDNSLQEELRRLRKENKILKEERDLLKKATAFFASQK